MNNFLLAALCAFFSFFFNNSVAAHAQTAPVLIYTCQDLQNLNNRFAGTNLTGNYQLANDIDCSDSKNWNAGAGFTPIGITAFSSSEPYTIFSGTLDGNGHAIKNLYINLPNTSLVGLFTDIGSSATVKNLKLQSFNITGNWEVGALAGEVDENGSPYGIEGGISNVIVSDSSISGANNVGGLLGAADQANIFNCAATLINVSSAQKAGGLVGILVFVQGLTLPEGISQSYTTGTVSGSMAGGLVGSISGGYVYNSYSVAHVTGTGSLGGLVGYVSLANNDSPIVNSYAAGMVDPGPNSGGIYGSEVMSDISYATDYWDAQTTGQLLGGQTGNGKATSLLFNQSTFVGWDFNNTWITNNLSYPILQVQEINQINLWNTFSAASQPNSFEAYSPPDTINWTNISNISSTGINWSDLLVMSHPPVWNFSTAMASSGAVNSVNWNYLEAMGNTSINWSDATVMSRMGINWSSVNPLVNSGINWIDWGVALHSGVNWNDVATISRTGLNWVNIGTYQEDVNWSNLAMFSHENVNWTLIRQLSDSNVNWESSTVLITSHLSAADLDTLRTIGVSGSVGGSQTQAAPAVYTVVATAGAGGSIAPNGSVNYTAGNSSTYTVSAVSGYAVAQFLVDGNPASLVNNTYTFTNISANHTISVTFSPITFTIKASSGVGGSISPSGNVTVGDEAFTFFTVVPNTHYTVAQVLIDGVAVAQSSSNTYAFNDVTANHTIAVSFNPVTFAINTSAGTGGSITPLGTINALYGSNYTFTVSADKYYKINKVLVDNAAIKLSSANQYTLSNITAPHSISASFTPTAYPITATAGQGGSITPAGQIYVAPGGLKAFVIMPARGYKLEKVLVDGKSVSLIIGISYVFIDVTKAHTISATFKK